MNVASKAPGKSKCTNYSDNTPTPTNTPPTGKKASSKKKYAESLGIIANTVGLIEIKRCCASITSSGAIKAIAVGKTSSAYAIAVMPPCITAAGNQE